jgi:hypothetical protein
MTIDHIDGDMYNNTIDNLQIMCPILNKQKGSGNLYGNNSSGMTSVVKCSATEKWKISFRLNGVLYIGSIRAKHD